MIGKLFRSTKTKHSIQTPLLAERKWSIDVDSEEETENRKAKRKLIDIRLFKALFQMLLRVTNGCLG